MFSAGKTATVGVVAILASIQMVPAPFLAAIGGAVGAGIGTVAGVVGAAAGVTGVVLQGIQGKKREVMPRGMTRVFKRQSYGNQQDWDLCRDGINTSNLVFSAPEVGVVLVEGLPPACMNLATVITGQFNEGNPVPISNNGIRFTNLSDDDIRDIQAALDGRNPPPVPV